MSLPVTCGEGNEYRTRDVASPAERGGRECRGKKYSIGGKVSLWRLPSRSLTSTLRSVAEVAVPRTASGPAGPGLAVTSPAGAASGGPPGRWQGRGSAGAGRVTRRGTGRSPATPSPAPPHSASGHSGSSGRTGQTRSWWRPGWSGEGINRQFVRLL